MLGSCHENTAGTLETSLYSRYYLVKQTKTASRNCAIKKQLTHNNEKQLAHNNDIKCIPKYKAPMLTQSHMRMHRFRIVFSGFVKSVHV